MINLHFIYSILFVSFFLNTASMEKPKSKEPWCGIPRISIQELLLLQKYEEEKLLERHSNSKATYNPPSLLFLAAVSYKNNKRNFEEHARKKLTPSKKLPQELVDYLEFITDNQQDIKQKYYGNVLLRAAKENCLAILTDLVSLRVNLNYRSLVSKGDSDRYMDRYSKNGLQIAREYGHHEFAELLIKLGAEDKAIDEDPREWASPLEIVFLNNHYKI